jgi:hypothetical protein
MTPRPRYLHNPLLSKHLVDKSRLDADASGKVSTQIACQGFKGWKVLNMIRDQQIQKPLSFCGRAAEAKARFDASFCACLLISTV